MMFLQAILLLTCFGFKSGAGFQGPKTVETINRLLNGFATEKWNQNEAACRRATENILNGVKNNTIWATWVWDSMQLPAGTFYGTVYHLGNFDQCLTQPWPQLGVQTQYCLVDVTMANMHQYDGQLVDPYDDVEKYVGAKFRFGKRLNTLYFGVCLPASCQPESVAKISRHIFSLSHLPFENVTVHPRDCQVADSVVEKPKGYYIFWFTILGMVITCVMKSVYGYTLKKPGSAVSKITSCFCLTRNLRSLTEVYRDEIRMMSGMRFLTCAIVIVTHFLYMSLPSSINLGDVEKILSAGYFWELPVHVDLCVVTFFLMSGLLHFRGLMSGARLQPFRTVLKRYLRLVFPLYALSIASIIYVQPHFGSGPLWPRMVRKHFEPCAKSWWRNLFMISNRVEKESLCSVTSWQLHCDFQLTVLGTALFMLYRNNKRIGLIFSWLVFVLSVVVAVIWNYWHDLPGLIWYDIGESLHFETNKIYATVYVPFYIRASSYLMGAAMGYFMAVHKPQDHKKIYSKSASVIGFILGMSVLVGSLAIGGKMFRNEFSPVWMAVLATFDKAVWAGGICLIIIVCEYGTLPIVNDFLGSAVFVPLSKLCFSAYLSHTIFITKDIYSLRTLAKFDLLNMITIGLGYVVITFSVSFIVYLFIEAPVTNLINLAFEFNRSPNTPKSITEEEEAKEAVCVNNNNNLLKSKKIL